MFYFIHFELVLFVCSLKDEFPLDRVMPVALVHQIYTLVKDRTMVDRQLVRVRVRLCWDVDSIHRSSGIERRQTHRGYQPLQQRTVHRCSVEIRVRSRLGAVQCARSCGDRHRRLVIMRQLHLDWKSLSSLLPWHLLLQRMYFSKKELLVLCDVMFSGWNEAVESHTNHEDIAVARRCSCGGLHERLHRLCAKDTEECHEGEIRNFRYGMWYMNALLGLSSWRNN